MFDLIAQYPLIAALLALVGLAAVFGAVLGFAAVRFKTEGNPIADQINDLLPQTQCGQCGYPGCRPYAEAIAGAGEAINKCPPGGEAGIQALAALLDMEAVPLDAEHGEEKVKAVAFIREAECIGCTKCIQACPVDAILGAAKQMHTVLPEACHACELCATECPTQAIAMKPVLPTLDTWHWPKPAPALARATH